MLMKFVAISLVISFPSVLSFAQSTPPSANAAAPAQPSQASAPKAAMQGFGLEDGTPVKLRTSRTVSSADAHTGDTVDFEVLEDVLVMDVLVVPKGSIAWGTVTDAQPKRRMARGGKLDVNIDSVRLADGEKVPLRAVFFPAAPLFLFMHGKDITIPKGTEITAYINGDTRLEEAKFRGGKPDATASAVTVTSALIDISSTPSGADIEVDGKFVGSTPSSISLAPGDHDVVVKKAGFSAWEKKLSVSPGHISLAAELAAESH